MQHVTLDGVFTEVVTPDITEQVPVSVLQFHSIVHRDIEPKVSEPGVSGYFITTPLMTIGHPHPLPLPVQYPPHRLMRHLMPQLVPSFTLYYVAMTTQIALSCPWTPSSPTASTGHPGVVKILLKSNFLPTRAILVSSRDEVLSSSAPTKPAMAAAVQRSEGIAGQPRFQPRPRGSRTVLWLKPHRTPWSCAGM